MAIAPYAVRPHPVALPEPSVIREAQDLGSGEARRECSPDEILVTTILERSAADVGWLAWGDGKDAVVIPAVVRSFLDPSAIGEFPDPPRETVLIDRGMGDGPWALWCRARGILSCAISPIYARGRVVGLTGLASCRVGALADFDVQGLQLVSSLAVHARTFEARLTGVRRMFDEVSLTLENALALDKALRLPPTYREIARSVGETLAATYCQIAIHDAKGALTIRGLGGHRPSRRAGIVALPLAQLKHCAQALRDRRGVVLKFSQYDPALEPERLALFSPTTKVGVILPFVAGPRTQGLLIIGEERRSRCQPMSPERVAILELVASRIAHILRMSRRLQYERMAERRRERRLTRERQHLAREVHDQIGQSLSGLLVQIRYAMTQGHAGPDELKVIEDAARKTIEGARSLAYGLRNLERGVGQLENARSYAETMLRAAHCTLSWTEERSDARVAGKVLREVARVLKESVNNIVRHAHATSVRIRVEYPDGRIRVTVQDNGVGFSVRKASPTKEGRGLGLVGSSERLERIGGVYDIRSVPKRGTLVVMEAPRR
ncbi:MAG TPA: ATP-binding protein [Candidatus Dormibacteraeota bacterium]|nr:ATP-binding protein [Candidatus Dormibacteraeota bacterium]